MNQQALERMLHWMKEQHLVSVLLSNPFNIAWLTGYAPPIQTGPSPFEGGPAIAWLREERLVLLTSDMESAAAQACGIQVKDYVAYTIDAPIAGSRNQAAALHDLLGEDTDLSGKIGIEYAYLPAALVESLRTALPNASFQEIDTEADVLRAVKTPQEIQAIRSALHLCDLAQSVVKELLRPGISEIELWGDLKARLECSAGGRLPVLTDLVAGLRTADIGGLPGEYRLQAGDPLIADIVPRLAGYWGDNAGTHFVGEPPAELKKIYQVVLDTLRMGVSSVRPGLRAGDLDQKLRAAIQNKGFPVYPHHSGHGIGASYHEEPRIVPYNSLPLEPGMVIALEPGIYLPGVGGVRLEDVVLVTGDGCELLTSHLL
jgi:Xaa-Pro aminopeptidase